METFSTTVGRWLTRIAGPPATTLLRHRVLNSVVFIGFFAAVYFLVADYAADQSIPHFISDLSLVLACAGAYYALRVRQKFRVTLHLITIFVIIYLCLNFFVNAGLEGPTLIVVEFLLTCLAFLHRPRSAIVYLSIGIALILCCVAVSESHPNWVRGYANPSAQLGDLLGTFLVCAVMAYVIMRMVNHFFDDTLEYNRSMQASSLQSEKMAALGELSATLLHELNSPLALVGAALSESASWWNRQMPELRRILGSLNLSQTASFWQLVERGWQLSSEPKLDSRTRRQFRDQLTVEFERRKFADASNWAEDVLDRGWTQWNSFWDPLAINEAGQAGFRYGLDLLAMQSSAVASLRAWERVDHLLDAVRSFSRTERRDAHAEPTDVTETVETVLTLYASHREVEVVRDYQVVPRIVAHADQLTQVWTNLVKNALQAMDSRGRLWVHIRRADDEIRVEITDSGPGLPPGAIDHVFETFFTTKSRKQGTGLGLSIVRRIVEAHGGNVTAENVPGMGARFTVRLPIATND